MSIKDKFIPQVLTDNTDSPFQHWQLPRNGAAGTGLVQDFGLEEHPYGEPILKLMESNTALPW